MTQFVVNKPVTTREPFVTVDGGLPVGTHRFQLVVVDSAGNESRPAVVTVTIKTRIIAPPPVG